MRRVLRAAVLLVGAALVPSASGEDRVRVDTFDRHGNRTGYVILDKQTGRIDAYDRSARHRSGYGKIAPNGRLEFFGPDGRWRGGGRINDPTPLTVPPKAGGERR